MAVQRYDPAKEAEREDAIAAKVRDQIAAGFPKGKPGVGWDRDVVELQKMLKQLHLHLAVTLTMRRSLMAPLLYASWITGRLNEEEGRLIEGMLAAEGLTALGERTVAFMKLERQATTSLLAHPLHVSDIVPGPAFARIVSLRALGESVDRELLRSDLRDAGIDLDLDLAMQVLTHAKRDFQRIIDVTKRPPEVTPLIRVGNPYDTYQRLYITEHVAPALLTPEAIAAVRRERQPVIDPIARRGYTAGLLRAGGVDVLAFDVSPDWWQASDGGRWTEVAEAAPEIAAEHPDRMLLVEPDRGQDDAERALRAFKGTCVAHIGGDLRDAPDDDFHRLLLGGRKIVKVVDISTWPSEVVHVTILHSLPQ